MPKLDPKFCKVMSRAIGVLLSASDVFGDTSKAADWMLRKQRALRGAKPADLCGTEAGCKKVLNALGKPRLRGSTPVFSARVSRPKRWN